MSHCIVIDHRQLQLESWLSTIFPAQSVFIKPIAGDASFRRYFRVQVGAVSYIAMDAPPKKEACGPFVAIATAFENASAVRFPKIHFSNMAQGFLLLSDFGDQQLLHLLNSETADTLYHSAMQTLLSMQRAATLTNLPVFNNALYWQEFDLFSDWYLKKNLQKQLSCAEKNVLRAQYQLLIDAANAQPSVFVHRDYHSRNLMVCKDGLFGVLDFQDAAVGPVTYDLVSLLRDCYIDWPIEKTEKWAFTFYQQLNIATDFSVFLRWFDWMGLQRHLKCLGIFSRLSYRDQKHGYLNDIPRVLNYALAVCDRYSELQDLKQFLMRA
ncbi:MAG: phosphotransferase [Coxiellaceae bacterium]|nr:phosphotransferase [Coxiellaceae bacterium]